MLSTLPKAMISYDDGNLDEEGKTAAFPFMNKLLELCKTDRK